MNENTRKIRAVIFDMDGLMFDTEIVSFQGYQKAAKSKGVEIDLPLYQSTLGLIRPHIRQTYINHFKDPDLVDYLMAEETRLAHETLEKDGPALKEGLVDLLDYLKEVNIPCAVASSSKRASVERYTKRTGVRPYFRALCCGDEVTKPKPDPQIFLTAAEYLGTAPEHCLVLEDSRNGLKAAKAGNFPAIMIPDMLPPDDEMKSLASKILPNLREVISYIRAENHE